MKNKWIILPYEGLGVFKFKDTLEEVLTKAKTLTNKPLTSEPLREFDDEYISVFLEDYRLLIVLYQDGQSIRYFDIRHDIYHMDVNLYKEKYVDLVKYYTEQDDEIKVDEIQHIFDTPKFGISVGLESNRRNCILVYSKEYTQEINLGPDEIIEYLLGYNPLKE